MTRWAAFIAIFMLLITPARADPASAPFLGTWSLTVGDRNLYVIAIETDGAGIGGQVASPTHLLLRNLGLFTVDGAGTRRDRIVRAHVANGTLFFTAQNAADPKDSTDFVMRPDGVGALLAIGGDPSALSTTALRLKHAPSGAAVASDWSSGRAYTIDDSETPNAEMKAIFDADQKDRAVVAAIDWTVVSKADAARRARTRELLAAGALHTGGDYEEASFVFQHGDTPDDYLLAHTLAMVAVSKGDGGAIWIAAATLDRYLFNIGRKQIYGTQFHRLKKDEPWTQEPYDRTLVSDALRRQLAVPPQPAQEDQLKTFQRLP